MKTKLRSQVVPRFGMTLIELMVVTTIIITLVAISVPVIRPMLASRKQSDAAATLEVFFNQAKLRAQETGRPCGVRFERYTDNNAVYGSTQVFPNNDVCIVVRQVEVPPPYAGNSTNSRVLVNRLNLYSATLTFTETTEYAFWNQMVSEGDKIQFDNQGPYYTITTATMDENGNGVAITGGYGSNASPVRNIVEAVSFKVLRAPQPTLTAPIGFPTGIVVDLQYSGMKDGDPAGPVSNPTSMLKPVGEFVPATGLQQEHGLTVMDKTPVIIMFSPSGDVMSYQKGNDGPLPPSAPINFLIGRWERSGSYWVQDSDDNWHRCETALDAANRGDVPFYLPEDGLRNYADLSNFWVTINPRTGMVSTNPVAPHDGTGKNPLGQSRAYTRTPQFNTGGR